MSKASEDAVALNRLQTVLDVAGAVLLLITLVFIILSIYAAVKAARAAEVAAKAVLKIERAHLRLDIPFELGWRVVPRKIAIAGRTSVLDEADHKFDIKFGFKNYGKTPATIQGIRAAVGCYSEYPERDIPDDGPAIFIAVGDTATDKE